MDDKETRPDMNFVAPATTQESEAAMRAVHEQEQDIFARHKVLEGDPDYQAILEAKALEVSQRYDASWFGDKFSGARDEDGYLLDKDGKPTNILPSQNHSGWTWGEAVRLANEEYDLTHPEQESPET